MNILKWCYLSLSITFSQVLLCEAQVIKSPDVDFTNTGIYHITAIHTTDSNSRVDMRITGLANRSIKIARNFVLADSRTEKRYKIQGIRGATFDEELLLPASGDTLVSLLFDKLPKDIMAFNFIEGDKTLLYGVSYGQKKRKKKASNIPLAIDNWLKQEIATSEKRMKKPQQMDFFRTDTAKIVGYLKGYDPRAEFSSGIIYHSNELTGEDIPTTIRFYEDGRFETALLINHPQVFQMIINEQWVSVYTEPGQTIAVLLDWDDFLTADRYRHTRYTFKHTSFMGSAASVNEELASFTDTELDFLEFQKDRNSMTPEDFQKQMLLRWTSERERLHHFLGQRKLSPLSATILAQEIDLLHANLLFEFTLNRDYAAKANPDNPTLQLPVTSGYYEFVKRIDLNDSTLLRCKEFPTFVNRVEFSELYPRVAFQGENAEAKLDSTFLAKSGRSELPFLYHVIKLRRLGSAYRYARSDSSMNQVRDKFNSQVANPFLQAENDRLYQKTINMRQGYEVPNTYAGNVFKNIISAHKGKVLVIDFWAQWCGPCRSGIESSLAIRQKLKDHPDLDFVFITDEQGTEKTFFDEYNAKNAMTNSYRIKDDEYLALRELFHFNAIPRYILVDAEGKIRDENFASYNLSHQLAHYFPEKFKDLAGLLLTQQ